MSGDSMCSTAGGGSGNTSKTSTGASSFGGLRPGPWANGMVPMTIRCLPNKYVGAGTYRFTLEDEFEEECDVGGSVTFWLIPRKGSYRLDTRVEGCGKKVGVNGAYVFADDGVKSVTLTPVISKGLGRWLNFEISYER